MNSQIHSSPYVPTRLRWQLAIYIALALIFCGLSAYHTIMNDIGLACALIGFLCGGLAGIAFSRILHISWDHGARQVIARFDAAGLVILVVYLLFEIFRTQLVSLVLRGPSVIIASFAVLAGIMIGRVIGMRGKIREILQEQQLID